MRQFIPIQKGGGFNDLHLYEYLGGKPRLKHGKIGNDG